MDFRDLVSNSGFRRDNPNVRNPINAGQYKMSIQGSKYHYSEPKKFVPVYDYTEMEVAIFDSNNKWVLPRKHLSQFEWSNLFEESDVNSVAGYVDIGIIQQMYDDLVGLSNG